MPHLPLLVEPAELEACLGGPDLLLVDLCKPESYPQQHLPGAVHLEYVHLIATRPPVAGLLPDAAALAELFGGLGIGPETHVVAYDDEGGGKAARLLWTLETVGHRHLSLLNGGIHAWNAEQRPLEAGHSHPSAVRFPLTEPAHGFITTEEILARLEAPGVALLDVRSADEFSGARRYSARGGHIPGAVNMEWTQVMDPQRQLRLRSDTELMALLEGHGVTKDKEVIVYCQTHHRSAHTYMVLRHLGYPRVAGYPGSWSEWGNREDTPAA